MKSDNLYQSKMAKKIVKKVRQKKGAKKSFYEIQAPLTATKIHLYSTGPEALIGKNIKLDLTKSLRGKSFELKLRVNQEGDKLIATPEQIHLAITYIRRVIRKGTDYVEDSFESNARDSKIRIKPFLIARRRISRKIIKILREEARKQLESYIKTRTSEELFSEIISNKLQKMLATKLKKIYPLALCEIRMLTVLGPLDKKESQDSKEENK